MSGRKKAVIRATRRDRDRFCVWGPPASRQTEIGQAASLRLQMEVEYSCLAFCVHHFKATALIAKCLVETCERKLGAVVKSPAEDGLITPAKEPGRSLPPDACPSTKPTLVSIHSSAMPSPTLALLVGVPPAPPTRCFTVAYRTRSSRLG